MKRKAYEEAGLSVAQQPSSRLMPATAEAAKLIPVTNTQNTQVITIAAAPEAMQLKTEKSAGQTRCCLALYCIGIPVYSGNFS